MNRQIKLVLNFKDGSTPMLFNIDNEARNILLDGDEFFAAVLFERITGIELKAHALKGDWCTKEIELDPIDEIPCYKNINCSCPSCIDLDGFDLLED